MKKFLIALIIPQLAGIIGSIFTMPAVGSWYKMIKKPSFTPPDWIFSPVWITLFLLMGIALYLVWKHGIDKKDVRVALWIFGIQLFLNVLWSGLFFGLYEPLWAFIDLCVLVAFIIATIYQFQKIDVRASLALLPYLFWCGFALILNYHIWLLNA